MGSWGRTHTRTHVRVHVRVTGHSCAFFLCLVPPPLCQQPSTLYLQLLLWLWTQKSNVSPHRITGLATWQRNQLSQGIRQTMRRVVCSNQISLIFFFFSF